MALPAAGNRITADLLAALANNSLQFIGSAQTAAPQNMTTVAADLTGTSLTFTTTYINTKITIWACYDVNYTNAADTPNLGSKLFVGTCLVDGTTQSGESHYNGPRATVFQEWITTLAASGSHTVKLQGLVNAALTGSCQTNATHTKWHALVFGP